MWRAPALVLAWPLRRWAFPHRPDFDGTHARHWNPCGDGDRLVEILDVDEHVAAELLARFRKRTVGHEPFAVAHPDAGRRRWGATGHRPDTARSA